MMDSASEGRAHSPNLIWYCQANLGISPNPASIAKLHMAKIDIVFDGSASIFINPTCIFVCKELGISCVRLTTIYLNGAPTRIGCYKYR